jgi:hypothetical protein
VAVHIFVASPLLASLVGLYFYYYSFANTRGSSDRLATSDFKTYIKE